MSALPFKVDPTTGEPFLRLASPHENIILTFPRFENADAVVEILNDRRLYPFVNSSYPHTFNDANSYTKVIHRTTDEVWSEIKIFGTDSGRVFGGCPVRSICEIQDDGRRVYLGDFGIGRWRAPEILDPELRAEESQKNLEKPIGDPSIIWSAGCKPLPYSLFRN
jgi:hypothetical protein